MCMCQAPLPAGCDLFTALSMLVQGILHCSNEELSGILHCRCIAESTHSASDAMLVLDECSDVLDQQEVEELKETEEKSQAAAQSVEKFHEKWRISFVCLAFVFSHAYVCQMGRGMYE